MEAKTKGLKEEIKQKKFPFSSGAHLEDKEDVKDAWGFQEGSEKGNNKGNNIKN